MQIKDRIRELRKSNSLTLADVSSVTGLSISYLSDIENGKANPSLNTLVSLSGAFDVTLNALLTGIDSGDVLEYGHMPHGLTELINEYNISPDWVRVLYQIQIQGERPVNKEAYLEIYLHLRRIIGR